MNVLMTADAVGGVWTYALDLCEALREHDIRVALATMGPRPSDAQRVAAEVLGNVRLVESDYRLEWMDDPWDDVTEAGDWLLSLASANDVDLVHLNGYSHAALPWGRPVVCVAHSCVMTWWQAVHGTEPPPQWDIYRGRVTQGLNSADIIISPSAAFLEQLKCCYEISRTTRVIHNARQPHPPRTDSSPELGPSSQSRPQPQAQPSAQPQTQAQAQAQAEAEAQSWPLRQPSARGDQATALVQGSPVVLACGRPWDASKNISVLSAAAEGAAWPAYVIGGVTNPNGETFASSSLRCLGALSSDDVEAWLERAAIFVHPALYEPFGLAVLEAAMANCALVLADIPTLRELWNGAAEFFDPHDSRTLRAVLDRLAADPSRRQALSSAARERATQYRMETTAAEYAHVYRTLTEEHVPGKGLAQKNLPERNTTTQRAVA